MKLSSITIVLSVLLPLPFATAAQTGNNNLRSVEGSTTLPSHIHILRGEEPPIEGSLRQKQDEALHLQKEETNIRKGVGVGSLAERELKKKKKKKKTPWKSESESSEDKVRDLIHVNVIYHNSLTDLSPFQSIEEETEEGKEKEESGMFNMCIHI